MVYHYPGQDGRELTPVRAHIVTSPGFSMARSPPATGNRRAQTQPPEWAGWKWIVFLLLGAAAAYGATILVNKSGWFARSDAPTPAPAPEPPLGPQPRPDGSAPPGMVWIPGGAYTMGTTDKNPHFADAPEHEVEVGGFWMDETEVSNAQFAEFVNATKYVTLAEQKPTLESIRAGLPPGEPDPDPSVLVPARSFTPPPDRC